MEIIFGTLRARAAGGLHTVSSNLNRSNFENRLEPYGSELGKVWRSGGGLLALQASCRSQDFCKLAKLVNKNYCNCTRLAGELQVAFFTKLTSFVKLKDGFL